MNVDYNDHRSDKRRFKTSMEGNKDVGDHISHQYRSLPSAASVFLITEPYAEGLGLRLDRYRYLVTAG
jgi:hypothetical protein